MSAQDNLIFFNENDKDNLFAKLSKYDAYELPQFMKKIVSDIYEHCCSASTWKDMLYLEKYDHIQKWSKMLTKLYNSKINASLMCIFNVHFFQKNAH